MKYKVWDKQGKRWVENMLVDGRGYLWYAFGDSLSYACEKDNFIVCRGFKFGDTWVFEGDKVLFDMPKLDDDHQGIKNMTGIVTCSESGLVCFDGWEAKYSANVRVVGNKYIT